MDDTQQFRERTLVGVDAMRLAAHAIGRGGTYHHDTESTVRLEAYQCTVTMTRNDGRIVLDVAPREGLEHGIRPAVMVMDADRLPGSPLFTVPIGDLHSTYAALFQKIAEKGVVTWMEHDGDQVCIPHAMLDGQRLAAAEHVDAIARGIDALTGQPSTYMRHPGLGTEPAFHPLAGDDVVASVPQEDDPDADRRAAGARIRLARAWCSALPEAITVRSIPGEGNRYIVGCHALTVAPPADRSEALRRSIRSYMALAAMDTTILE